MTDLSKIAYFVPNLPRLEIDKEKFWAWWDSVSTPINRIQKDSRGNTSGYNGEFWDGVTIWQKPEYQKTIVWKVNYHPNEELFSKLIEDIISALPWYDVQGLTLWSNKIAVPIHQDGLPRDLFPSAPRVVLIDDCENRTFYLVEKTKFKRFIPDLTTGPNLFFFNNENCLHGAMQPLNGRKILIRIDGPLIDAEGFKGYINTQLANSSKYEGAC